MIRWNGRGTYTHPHKHTHARALCSGGTDHDGVVHVVRLLLDVERLPLEPLLLQPQLVTLLLHPPSLLLHARLLPRQFLTQLVQTLLQCKNAGETAR